MTPRTVTDGDRFPKTDNDQVHPLHIISKHSHSRLDWRRHGNHNTDRHGLFDCAHDSNLITISDC